MDKLRKIVVVLVIVGLTVRVFRGNPKRELEVITTQLQTDLTEGIEQLEEFVDDYPKYKDGWALLGQAYLNIDRVKTAEEAFRRALELDEELVGAVVGLAVSLRLQGEVIEAQALYERAIRIEPNHANALSSLSVIYVIQQHHEKAVKVAERAAKLEPDNPYFFANLCLAYHARRDTKKRDEAAETAERLGYPHIDRIREMIHEEPTGAVELTEEEKDEEEVEVGEEKENNAEKHEPK